MKNHKVLNIIFLFIFLFFGCSQSNKKLWPDGKIPFVVYGFSPEEELIIYTAMLEWEEASKHKIKFIDITLLKNNKTKCLKIIHSNDKALNGSTIGKTSYNLILIGDISNKIILHELGHVIGLEHEHQRPDALSYITLNINFKKNSLLELSQYIPKTSNFYDYTQYPYDYKSIMHYSIIESNNIIAKPIDCGGDTISLIDALKVEKIYSTDNQIYDKK
jgi:hypothetical protein